MQECNCQLPESMSWAGPAAQLCHHSDNKAVQEIEAKLLAILQDFHVTIPFDEMGTKTIMDLADKFKMDTVGDDFKYMNQAEHTILMIAFLRNLSISAQALMANLILRHEANLKQEASQRK